MVSLPAGFTVDKNTTSGAGTTAVGVRLALAAMLKQSAPGVPVRGRLAADHFVVTGSSSNMNYLVSGGGLVLTRNAPNGAYIVGYHQQITVAGTATGGVNPRIDRIYALQPDPGIDGLTTTDPQFIVDVAIGTPAASPTAPAIPTGALELARKLVSATATNTASGAAFTNVAPVTGLLAPAAAPIPTPSLVAVDVDASGAAGGAIVLPGATTTIVNATLSGTFPAGTVIDLSGSVQLNGYANVDLGGQLILATSTNAVIKSRRWHNRTRAGQVYPSTSGSYVLPTAATNPVFRLRVLSDSLSVGGIEVWDGDLHVRALRAVNT